MKKGREHSRPSVVFGAARVLSRRALRIQTTLPLVSRKDPSPTRSVRSSSPTSSRTVPAVAGSLEVTAISANCAISHESWDGHWATQTSAIVNKHEHIADNSTSPSLRHWHRSRARGLKVSREAAVAHCGTSDVVLRCGCDQWRVVPRACRRRVLCNRCDKSRAREYARRVRQSVQHHIGQANQAGMVDARGLKARVYLVTLTIPHEDERGAAEARLDAAWRAMRQHAPEGHWSRSCLAVLEWTPGRDGKGHPHLHVVVVARWLDYGHIWATWRDACLEVGAREPSRAAQDVRVAKDDRRGTAEAAARYVAKYVAKTSGQLYTVEEWARLAAYQVGRRTVRATRGWWHYDRPVCACCEQRYVWVGPPGSRRWAVEVAVERDGFWLPQHRAPDAAEPPEARGPPDPDDRPGRTMSQATREVRARVAAWGERLRSRDRGRHLSCQVS